LFAALLEETIEQITIVNKLNACHIEVGKMMFFPYARIIPMHLTILFGGILSSWGTFAGKMTLAFFMLLKTFADVIMHIVEKNGFGDKPGESEEQGS
jgi:hypothetical protein